MSPHRSERVADVIREVLAKLLLLEVRDPRIGFVTLTEVELSPDLKHARVFVSLHGEEPARRDGVRALNHAAPYFRRALAREGRLRFTPSLRFEEDAAAERGMRVEAALREIHEADEKAGDRREESEGEEDRA